MTTTIQISDSVKKILERMKLYQRETYNEVIERILEDDLEIAESTKKEIDEAKKRVRFGKTIKHEEVLSLYGLK